MKRVIVTGGATNIGRAITEAFLAEGAQVIVGQPDIGVATSLLQLHPDRLRALRIDVSSPAACRDFVESAATAMGGIDVLVNNAAVTGPGALRTLDLIDQEHFDSIFNVNVRGALFCSQAAVSHLQDSGEGVIINISSINAFRPQRGAMVYAASKAALSSLTQSMAKELAGVGIRVVAVAPGDIATDLPEQPSPKAAPSPIVSDIVGFTPLGQGRPADIGAVVVFVSSPKAHFVTGTTWLVDGGILA